MSTEATRMQEFSKNFRGDTPDPTAGWGDPSSTHPQPGLKRPGVGTQTLVPLNFSAAVAPLGGSALFLLENT